MRGKRGRDRIAWDAKAKNAGLENSEKAFAAHVSSGGSYKTKPLAETLGVSEMSLLLELKRRGKKIHRCGAPIGNTNNRLDLKCELFGFTTEEEMLNVWRKDGLSGRAIAKRISTVLHRDVGFSTIHNRLRKLEKKS